MRSGTPKSRRSRDVVLGPRVRRSQLTLHPWKVNLASENIVGPDVDTCTVNIGSWKGSSVIRRHLYNRFMLPVVASSLPGVYESWLGVCVCLFRSLVAPLPLPAALTTLSTVFGMTSQR